MGKKVFIVGLLMAMVTYELTFFGSVSLGMAQTGTQVGWMIASDTTWRQADSPYDLTTPLTINTSATLTIDAGAVVNLNGYFLQVNGTIVANGTSSDRIQINGGSPINVHTQTATNYIQFSGNSSVNSTIENAVLKSTNLDIYDSSTISNNRITGNIIIANGSPIISNNTISGDVTLAARTLFSNNVLNGTVSAKESPTITNNSVTGAIDIYGSPTITRNTVRGIIGSQQDSAVYVSPGSEATISNNTIIGEGAILGISVNAQLLSGGSATITNNIIEGFTTAGIQVANQIMVIYDPFATIENNWISNNSYGIYVFNDGVATIEKNVITNNTEGIHIGTQGLPEPDGFGPFASATIQTNTIADNSEGIVITGMVHPITNNNFEENTLNIDLVSQSNVDATQNWWGTTDVAAINQTIHDFKNDLSSGNVIFIPFLKGPDTDAPSIPTASPTQTPNVSTSNSPSPTVPEFPTFMIVAVLMLVVTVSSPVLFRKRR